MRGRGQVASQSPSASSGSSRSSIVTRRQTARGSGQAALQGRRQVASQSPSASSGSSRSSIVTRRQTARGRGEAVMQGHGQVASQSPSASSGSSRRSTANRSGSVTRCGQWQLRWDTSFKESHTRVQQPDIVFLNLEWVALLSLI